MTLPCGGSGNRARFIDLFDGVFVLEIDPDTLLRRLSARPEDEWGGRTDERELVLHLHETGRGPARPVIGYSPGKTCSA